MPSGMAGSEYEGSQLAVQIMPKPPTATGFNFCTHQP